MRLTLVRAEPQASIYVTRVCIMFHATAYVFFWLKSARTVLRVPFSLTVLAGSITSRSIGVVGNCFIGQLTGFALQPARVFPYSALVAPDTRRHLSTRARYLWLRAVCLWRTKRLGVKAASTSMTLLQVALSECVRARLFTDINEGSLARISQLLNSSDRCQKVSGTLLNR